MSQKVSGAGDVAQPSSIPLSGETGKLYGKEYREITENISQKEKAILERIKKLSLSHRKSKEFLKALQEEHHKPLMKKFTLFLTM